MSRWIGVMALVALCCAACGGEAPQVPAGPSSTGVPSSPTQTAKILGNRRIPVYTVGYVLLYVAVT